MSSVSFLIVEMCHSSFFLSLLYGKFFNFIGLQKIFSLLVNKEKNFYFSYFLYCFSVFNFTDFSSL